MSCELALHIKIDRNYEPKSNLGERVTRFVWAFDKRKRKTSEIKTLSKKKGEKKEKKKEKKTTTKKTLKLLNQPTQGGQLRPLF